MTSRAAYGPGGLAQALFSSAAPNPGAAPGARHAADLREGGRGPGRLGVVLIQRGGQDAVAGADGPFGGGGGGGAGGGQEVVQRDGEPLGALVELDLVEAHVGHGGHD